MKTKFTARFGSQIKSFSSRKWITALVLGLSLWGNGYGQLTDRSTHYFDSQVNSGTTVTAFDQYGISKNYTITDCDAFSDRNSQSRVFKAYAGIPTPSNQAGIPAKLNGNYGDGQGIYTNINIKSGHRYKIEFTGITDNNFFAKLGMYFSSGLNEPYGQRSCDKVYEPVALLTSNYQTIYYGNCSSRNWNPNTNLFSPLPSDNGGNDIFNFTANSNYSQFAITYKNDGGPNDYSTLQIGKITITDLTQKAIDDNQIKNNSICVNYNGTCSQNLNVNGQVLNNISVTGSTPTGGSLSGATNVVYSYKWYYSLDNVNFNLIAGATAKDLNTSLSYTNGIYFRRVVTTTDYPAGAFANALIKNDNPITNNNICINFNGTCSSSVSTSGQTFNNISITGSTPNGGSYSSANASNYTYKWYYSLDNSNFTLISGATSKDLTSNIAFDDKIYFKREVTTTDYPTANTATAQISNPYCEINASAMICKSQTVYFKRGEKAYFNKLLGSVRTPNEERPWKFVWEWSKDNFATNWNKGAFAQKEFKKNEQTTNTGISSQELTDNLPISFLTSDYPSVQTFYIRRRPEEWHRHYYSLLDWDTDWYPKEETNSVTFTIYRFQNPKNQTITISSNPNSQTDGVLLNDVAFQSKCGQQNATFFLIDPTKPVGQQKITDPTAYGISNIEWTIPSSWQGYSLSGAWATSIQPNFFSSTNGYGINNNIPSGGTVSYKLTYLDGQTKTGYILVNPPVVLSANVSATVSTPQGSIISTNPLTISMCATTIANFKASVTNSTPYTATWSVDNQPALTDNGLNYSLSGQTLSATNYVNLTLSDNNSSCIATYPKVATVKIGNPGQGWAAYNFYAAYPNMIPVEGANIVTDQIGLPYYAAGKHPTDGSLAGGIWVWKYIGNAWSDQKIATDNNVDGEIALYQPTASVEPVIYYSATNQAKTQRILYKVVRTAGVWGSVSAIYTFPTSAPITLRSAPNGDLYFLQVKTIYKLAATNGQVNAGVVETKFLNALVSEGTKFAVSSNYVYYITNGGNVLRVKDMAGNTINTSNQIAKTGTDVLTDINGNGYFVDANNTIRQFFVKKFPEDPAAFTFPYFYGVSGNGFPGCNGKFSVNFETGVVYATGTDLNIYQLYNNGPDNWVTQNISPIAYSSGYISSQTDFNPKGTLLFSKVNVFYVSTDAVQTTKNGNIKLITFKTSSICQPARTRMDNSTESNDADFLSRPKVETINANNSLIVAPNPVENAATITYTLVDDANVSITLLNSLGETVKVVLTEVQNAGIQSASLEGNNLSKGLYFVRLQANEKIITTKIILK